MFVTVKYQADDPSRRQAEVTGVYQSAEQAAQGTENGPAKKEDLLKWPNHYPPRIGQPVGILDGQIAPSKRPGLIELLDEKVFKRKELAELREKSKALEKHNSKMETRIKDCERIHHAHLCRDRKTYQVTDLWISALPQTAKENLLADYAKAEAPTLHGRIMVVPGSEVMAFCNRLAQENRVGNDSLEATRGMGHSHSLLHRGDRVQFARTDNELNVRDGELGEIVELYPEQRTILVAIDDREDRASNMVFVPLREYADVDLGYATTYDRALKHELYQAFVLADQRAPTRQLVDSLAAKQLEIYADRITAAAQFPEIAGKQQMGQAIDQKADPLIEYERRSM